MTDRAVTLATFEENPFFRLCREDPDVVEIFGVKPLRVYPFGEAPQGSELPFATYQLISGGPENYLSGRPDIDRLVIQVSVFADKATLARKGARNIIAAVECDGYVDGYAEGREAGTRHYRITFTADLWVHRRTR